MYTRTLMQAACTPFPTTHYGLTYYGLTYYGLTYYGLTYHVLWPRVLRTVAVRATQVAYEPFLPDGMKWWQLFDLVIVSACKPDFFSEARRPSYQVATPDGMLREVQRFERSGWYAGGNARMLEKVLGCRGEEVLYVGDHIFTDVNMAKKGLSWRTCMILQAPHMHCTCPARALHTRCTCTTHALHTRRTRTAHALHMHCTCTAHALAAAGAWGARALEREAMALN